MTRYRKPLYFYFTVCSSNSLGFLVLVIPISIIFLIPALTPANLARMWNEPELLGGFHTFKTTKLMMSSCSRNNMCRAREQAPNFGGLIVFKKSLNCLIFTFPRSTRPKLFFLCSGTFQMMSQTVQIHYIRWVKKVNDKKQMLLNNLWDQQLA